MNQITTIIQYNTNDIEFLKSNLQQSSKFSDNIIVTICDYLFNGEKENEDLLNKSYQIISEFEKSTIIKIKYDTNNYYPPHYYHNLSRFVGAMSAKTDWLFFLDCDEIVTDKFKDWFDSNKEKELAFIFNCYWYFREPIYRAKTEEAAGLLIRKSDCKDWDLFSKLERAQFYQDLYNKDKLYNINHGYEYRIVDNSGELLMHHFSWVRDKQQMLSKVKNWGHKDDKDWVSLVEEEFSRDFNGTDFIHGYQYDIVDNIFNIKSSYNVDFSDKLDNLDYTIYDCFIDGFSFKFRDISSSNAVRVIINELLNNEYGLFNININKDETFIDVGANIGIISIYVKKKFGCKVISFEPSPYNIENFKANILLNGFNLSDFNIYEKAVTDNDGDLVYISKKQKNMGGCSILTNDENSNSVETISLSKFITSDVSYIKIDCEGSEYKIIPSIKDKLSNVKYIGIELHRLNIINETPIDLYYQIRETFTGKMFISVWDDGGKNATDYLKKKLLDIDMKNNMKNNELFYTDSDSESQWGIISSNKFKINQNQSKRFFCVDNFYEDPYSVRQLALSAEYFEGEGAVGSRTRKQFLFEGVKEKFEEIMGKKILDNTPNGMGWFDGGINGRFQTCKAGTPLVYHCDSQMWAGMIYLTPDAPPQCGTTFFKHRKTGIRHNFEIDWESGQGLEVFNQKTFLDGTPYEMVDKIGNVFNRLVIFDGGLIHSASEYFGWDLESSRLFHMFFFNTEN